MKSIEVELPIDAYDKLLAKFGSRKRIEDVFSVRLEDKLKREIYLLRKRDPEFEHKQKLTICISESLYPMFVEFCIHRSQTKQDVILKMMKKVISRK